MGTGMLLAAVEEMGATISGAVQDLAGKGPCSSASTCSPPRSAAASTRPRTSSRQVWELFMLEITRCVRCSFLVNVKDE